jgi:hypothetical protein
MSLPREGPVCCERPSKVARREGYLGGRHWWIEFYRCKRCGAIMIEFTVDGSAHMEDINRIRTALLTQGEITEL